MIYTVLLIFVGYLLISFFIYYQRRKFYTKFIKKSEALIVNSVKITKNVSNQFNELFSKLDSKSSTNRSLNYDNLESRIFMKFQPTYVYKKCKVTPLYDPELNKNFSQEESFKMFVSNVDLTKADFQKACKSKSLSLESEIEVHSDFK